MKMRMAWVVSVIGLATCQWAAGEQFTFAQFIQPAGVDDFLITSNLQNNTYTFETADTTTGVPISLTYQAGYSPATNPQPARLVVSATTSSFSLGPVGAASPQYASVAFNDLQNDLLSITDADGNNLLTAHFTGTLFLVAANNTQTTDPLFDSASLSTSLVTYVSGVYPSSGSIGQFSIGLSNLAPNASQTTYSADGAGTFATLVPEPTSLGLLSVGLGGLVVRRRRKA